MKPVDFNDKSKFLTTGEAVVFLGLPPSTSSVWLDSIIGLKPAAVGATAKLYSVSDLNDARHRLIDHFCNLLGGVFPDGYHPPNGGDWRVQQINFRMLRAIAEKLGVDTTTICRDGTVKK